MLDLPRAAAFGGTVIMRVCLCPQRMAAHIFPQNLWVGTDEKDILPAFETFAVGGVQKLIIVKIGGVPHKE